MMTLLTLILKNWKYILISVGLLFCVYLYNTIDDLKAENNKLNYTLFETNQNLYAAKDSISVLVDENGKVRYEKGVLLGDLNNLSDKNRRLVDDISGLNNQILSLTNVIGSFNKDSIKTEIGSYTQKDSLEIFEWNYKEEPYFSLTGLTTFKITINDSSIIQVQDFTNTITNTNIDLGITTYITEVTKGENKGKLKTIVKSDNPYVSINNINTILFDIPSSVLENNNLYKPSEFNDKNKKWNISVGPGIGYGLYNDRAILIPTLSVYIGRSIIRF